LGLQVLAHGQKSSFLGIAMWVYTSAALEDDRQGVLTSSSSLKKQKSVSRTAHRRKIMRGKSSFTKRSATLVLLVFGLLLGAAWAQTESVLYSFCGQTNCADGALPYAGLVFDQKGNLYGTTFGGGGTFCKNGCGVVFQLTPDGKETVLYAFCAQTNCTDGADPEAGLVFDQKGNLYGTTFYGGAYGEGTVFKLTPQGKETVLYSFCAQSGCADGKRPYAGVILDQKGNLYGTTVEGGASSSCNGYGCGVVFKLTPQGKETVLYTFCSDHNCTDGAGPYAGLVFDQKGNLYGTTAGGGAHGGTVFKLTPKGKETVLHSFCAQINCSDGAFPNAGLVFDQKGDLYGTTTNGGSGKGCPYNDGGCGVVFMLAPEGKETVLYSFCAQYNCIDGAGPFAGLVFDQNGNLYGTAGGGAPRAGGVVFELTPKGKETVLYSFCWQDNCTDGQNPYAGLVFDQKGNLYGTTASGGAYGCGYGCGGVIFKLAP
jgi:uncharacterized repeat protein (TIGR03803 family)